MKNIRLRTATPYDQLKGLVFFAQRMQELLFDHTDDSYKSPALNTFSRTLELEVLADIATAAKLGENMLKPFFEELKWSISEDQALEPEQKMVATIQLGKIEQTLGTPDRLGSEISALRLSFSDYFKQITSKLIDLAINHPEKKGAISKLATDFSVQIETEGFSRRYAYHMTQFLIRSLNSKGAIDPAKTLNTYLEKFSIKESDWTVIFLADNNAMEFAQATEKFRFEITQNLPEFPKPPPETIQELLAARNASDVFIVFRKIEARDAIKAREIAESVLLLFLASVRFFCHDRNITIRNTCLVENTEKQTVFAVGKIPDPMHFGKIKVKEIPLPFVNLFNEVMLGIHLDDSSTRRIASALEYHKAALEASVPENQLIDLWAALEGLLPQPSANSPRIEFFLANLVAPITLTYPEKLLKEAFNDFTNTGGRAVELLTSVTNAKDDFERFVFFLVAEEYEELRQEAAARLSMNPLLLYRLWKLSELFKSKNRIRETLQNHRKKVSWHIARIYAQRNSIVHNAIALPYLRTLVGNLHNYLDILLFAVTKVSTESSTKLNIETTLSFLLAQESTRFVELEVNSSKPDTPCNVSNTWAYVFGASNPLAPRQIV